MGGVRAGALAMVMAAVLAAGCGGKGVGETIVPIHGEASTPVSATAPRGTTPPGGATLTDRAVADRFEQLLEQNNGARAQVTSSVQGVSACTSDPTNEHNTLGGVIRGRKNLVDQVNNLDVRALPEGQNLKDNLVQAWQASIAADVHFQGWMTAVASSGCTRNGVNSGPEWDAASAASTQATAFKRNFSTVWGAVAARFGLRTWAEGEL